MVYDSYNRKRITHSGAYNVLQKSIGNLGHSYRFTSVPTELHFPFSEQTRSNLITTCRPFLLVYGLYNRKRISHSGAYNVLQKNIGNLDYSYLLNQYPLNHIFYLRNRRDWGG